MTSVFAKKHAILAFTEYASLGCPDINYIKEISDKNQRDDLLAVVRMFEGLDREDKNYISAAVRDVYMITSSFSRRSSVSSRVLAHAMSNYADVRTVWRWLSYARNIFAEFRADEKMTVHIVSVGK